MMKSHHSKTILAWVGAPSFSYSGPDGECEFIPRMTERFRYGLYVLPIPSSKT